MFRVASCYFFCARPHAQGTGLRSLLAWCMASAAGLRQQEPKNQPLANLSSWVGRSLGD